MSTLETAKGAYAGFVRNEAEGTPFADRNPYVGPQAVGEGVLARLAAAIDNFTTVR